MRFSVESLKADAPVCKKRGATLLTAKIEMVIS
jgi:hypothetical protein